MDLIIEYWQIIVALVSVIIVIGCSVFYFFKRPSKKQLNQIKAWLLLVVVKAEAEFGSGTGVIKLRFVYDVFLTKFKWIAYFMSFEAFSLLVDEALDEMKKMLTTNPKINEIVNSKDTSK